MAGRAGTGSRGRERPSGPPGAAVHCHILYRMNAINDALKEILKKRSRDSKVLCRAYFLHKDLQNAIITFFLKDNLCIDYT